MTNKITVIGSANVDFVIHSDKMPKLGETLIGNNFQTNAGGKGLNQAVAIAKLNGNVSFLGAVGKDSNGEFLLNTLTEYGVEFKGNISENALPLEEITHANQFQPFTWEGCVVKICDKISYLGRDIEDAVTLKIITEDLLDELKSHAIAAFGSDRVYKINTTNLIYLFTNDLCKNSSPETGLTFSQPVYELMRELMRFNYANIYGCKKLALYKDYAESVIETVFRLLLSFYDGESTFDTLKKAAESYPEILREFNGWLSVYAILPERWSKLHNRAIFDLSNREDYVHAVICYISGMTDHYLKKVHSAIHSF